MRSKITIVLAACFISNSCALSVLSATKLKGANPAISKQAQDCKKLLVDGHVDECEKQLEQYLRQNASDLDARKVHAEALFALGRFHYAADELKPVLEARPDDPEACLLDGKIYQSMHNPETALAFYKKFLQLSPNDERAGQYRTLIDVLDGQTSAKSNANAQAGNYLAAVTQHALMRWKTPKQIVVYIKDGTGVEGYRPEFEESLRQAFDDWALNTNGLVGFQFTSDPAKGQMSVTWTSDLHAPALKAEAGLAKLSYGSDGIDKADIFLLTLDPFKDGPIGRNYLYNVCLHEIGHALGLQGHSPHDDDIMSPSLYAQQGLSARDINTLIALYSDEHKAADTLPEVDEYGRPLPQSVKAERLESMGTSAAMSGDYDGAILKLQAALKLNPQLKLAKQNLAVAANNLAIAEGTTPDKAQKLLRLALYWDPQNDAYRQNLNALIQNSGKDPKSFAVRVALAEQCLTKHDSQSAAVEYAEALRIKNDPALAAKLSQLKASLK